MTEWFNRGSVPAVDRARLALLILLSAAAVAAAVFSFQLNFGYDTAQMLYYGRLIAQAHSVPYRDIFEENLPGAMLAYTGIGILIDYSNRFLLRVFDLVYLTAIGLATWRWLRPLGRPVAWGAAALFGLYYLLGGPGFSTQREYVFLLPVVAAIAIASAPGRMPEARRAFLTGLLFGVATTIKPHAAIGLLPVWVCHYFDLAERQGGRRPTLGECLRVLVFYGLGGLIPVAGVLAYLVISGGWQPWLAIVTNYWPLYATLTDQMNVLTGADRARYIAGNLLEVGGKWPWLIPVTVGAVLALRPGALTAHGRRRVWLSLGLLVCYILYPAITGQFYPQHWLPMTFFILAAAALCFIPARRPGRWWIEVAPLAALIVALGLTWDSLSNGAGQMADYFVYHKPPPPSDGDRAAEIAGYLEDHLQPGDTVQPLDQVGYGMHGMLLARAQPATRFQADAQFYEEPGLPYIRGLRAEFVDALRAHPPRYVIDVVARARIQTEYTVTPFTDFEKLLREDYSPVYVGHGFLIYEHLSGARPGLVVYPTDYSGATTQELAAFKPDVEGFALGRPVSNLEAAYRRLNGLLEGHDHLYFENLGDESESSLVLESLLNQRAYRVGEQRYAATRLVEYLSEKAGCLTGQPVDEQFGDAIALRLAGAVTVDVSGRRYVCATLEMEGLRPISQAYVVSVHILDGAGRTVAQYDSQPQGNLAPTTGWTPGDRQLDRFAIALPGNLPPGKYTARLFLYDAATQANLLFRDGEPSLLIGTLRIP